MALLLLSPQESFLAPMLETLPFYTPLGSTWLLALPEREVTTARRMGGLPRGCPSALVELCAKMTD